MRTQFHTRISMSSVSSISINVRASHSNLRRMLIAIVPSHSESEQTRIHALAAEFRATGTARRQRTRDNLWANSCCPKLCNVAICRSCL
jgi:hypothetical protein